MRPQAARGAAKYARVAQPVEHFLGKEEVSGSSPDASSEDMRFAGLMIAPEGVGCAGERKGVPPAGVALAPESVLANAE